MGRLWIRFGESTEATEGGCVINSQIPRMMNGFIVFHKIKVFS